MHGVVYINADSAFWSMLRQAMLVPGDADCAFSFAVVPGAW